VIVFFASRFENGYGTRPYICRVGASSIARDGKHVDCSWPVEIEPIIFSVADR